MLGTVPFFLFAISGLIAVISADYALRRLSGFPAAAADIHRALNAWATIAIAMFFMLWPGALQSVGVAIGFVIALGVAFVFASVAMAVHAISTMRRTRTALVFA